MQQRKRKGKEETSSLNVNQNVTKSAPHPQHQTKDTHTCAKKRPTRNGNNRTKKINPTKSQTHLNTPEPHGQYSKSHQQIKIIIFWPHHAFYYLVGKGEGEGVGNL